MNSNRARLGAEYLAELVSELVGSCRAECHHRREYRSSSLRKQRRQRVRSTEPHAASVLHVRCNEKRNASETLHVIELGRVAERHSYRENEPADLVVLDPCADLLVFRRADGCIFAWHPRHDELRDSLARRQRSDRRLHPRRVLSRERR